MKLKFGGILIISIFLVKEANAQAILSGTIYDIDTKVTLSNVLVRNTINKQLTITGKSGNFRILAAANDLLIFTLHGYVPDTLYLIDLTPKKIEMVSATNTLSEVQINASSVEPAFDPQQEYPEVYEKSKFALSPTRLFGKDARNARHLKHYFDNEIKQRRIDSIFNRTRVSDIIPLKGRDLRNFMTLYRPRLSFLNKSSPADLNLYINACYKKFRQLTPKEQALPRLY